MAVVCEEVFDDSSHPSIDEIRDYANKIGIDPDAEPQLLQLAAEGLMKALPPGWRPVYNEKSKSYYYYNNATGKTQWEHPLDDVYRGLVRKVRAESQSLSLGEPTEDATYARDDELLSLDELPPRRRLQPLPAIGAKVRADDLGEFDKHPRSLERTELRVSGNGAMFLKSNTKRAADLSPGEPDGPRSILRERNSLEVSKSLEFDRVSLERDEDDKKSVRFNLDNTTDVAFTFSDKSSSSDDLDNVINVKIKPNAKPRFTVTTVDEQTPLKVIRPNPGDFIKPKLTLSKDSDSDEESLLRSTTEKNRGSESDEDDLKFSCKTRRLEEKAEKRFSKLKQNIWEEKNDELTRYRDGLQASQKGEFERILIDAKTEYEEKIKDELKSLRIEMENRHTCTLLEERTKHEKELESLNAKLESEFDKSKQQMVAKYETKRDELEKYYDEKLVEIERELAEKMERKRDDLILNHNSTVDQLKQNHSIILDELKKEFQLEEDELRREHKNVVCDLKIKVMSESDRTNDDSGSSSNLRRYEKMRGEKRQLEDKYRCLKEKYLRLKTEVKQSIEKRNNRRKEQVTTGSETERSNSNNKDRTPLNSPQRKPPAPPSTKHHRTTDNGAVASPPPTATTSQTPAKIKPENRTTKQLIIQDLSTSSLSDKSELVNEYDSSDNNSSNPGRSRRKLFSRLKSSSTSRITNNNNNNNNIPKSKRTQQRSCSPVENLRRQLQKLEDLEDQFPQNAAADTYHLRYPFGGDEKFEGSSELEFFRHRIHLERDSIKRAKESLRSQKSLFQQRQKDLKLKHGSMARHTLQQLCQEEKELTDMEVSLHRTRSLLGEKVIRLRHLEQSLQRASVTAENRIDDATLSDISSHSASSGISSTEFATADAMFQAKGILHGEHLQESSEIIQSLENLNSEIREIWDVLRKQQSSVANSGLAVLPPLFYPDFGWPLLAATATASVPAPPSIPTLADRLHNYRQHVALSNAQSTVVTQAANQAATTTLVERTRNLRHWLRQAGIDNTIEGGNGPPQATL